MKFRSTVNLGARLERNLLSYATAASVGLGITAAFSLPAEAEVIYTPVRASITTGGAYYLDLDLDGHADFKITDTAYIVSESLFVQPQFSAFNAIQIDRFGPAAALNRGMRIGSGNKFYGCLGCSYGQRLAAVNGSQEFGDWVNVTNRYLGFKFQIKGQTHYGWARVTVQVQGTAIKALVTGYAYESIPNQAILAGQRSGSLDTSGLDATPAAPGSLGTLALGFVRQSK